VDPGQERTRLWFRPGDVIGWYRSAHESHGGVVDPHPVPLSDRRAPGLRVSRNNPVVSEKSGLRQVLLWPKIWFKTNLVVHGRDEPLTRAEIALRSFDRSVTKQELDLLQFSSSGMAQAGTRAAEVMRG
jgi:hypothetical protein